MLLGKYRKDKLNFWSTQYKNVKQYLDGEQVVALCIFWVPFEGIPQKLDGLDCETDCLSDFWGQLKNQEFLFYFFIWPTSLFIFGCPLLSTSWLESYSVIATAIDLRKVGFLSAEKISECSRFVNKDILQI